MSRSVSYLNNAEVVLYFPFQYSDSPDFYNFEWDDMVDNLIYEIKAKLPSYYILKDEWDNRETRIILQNNLCIIGISEYCGLVSLSVAPRENDYNERWAREQFSVYHANQIKSTLEKVITTLGLNRLNKIGTFSNGEAVFETAK
jgi:hypothetical protein